VEVLLESQECSRRLFGWEALVTEAWMSSLGLPLLAIGFKSSFLELGGDSLAALRVSRFISKRIQALKQVTSKGGEKKSGGGGGGDGMVDGVFPNPIIDDDVKEGGEFGELLGHLSPRELITRPRLDVYSEYLKSTYIGVEGLESLGEEEGEEEALKHEDEPYLDKSVDASKEAVNTVATEGDGLDGYVLRAASDEQIELLRALFKLKADVHPRQGLSALHSAAASSSLPTVSFLLRAKASPGKQDAHGVSPLHLASQNSNPRLLKELVNAHASLGIKDKYSQ